MESKSVDKILIFDDIALCHILFCIKTQLHYIIDAKIMKNFSIFILLWCEANSLMQKNI